VVIVVAWSVAAVAIDNPSFLPTPLEVASAWVDMFGTQGFLGDVGWSAFRIVGGSCWRRGRGAAGPADGLLRGRPLVLPAPINAIRYMPASASSRS